MEMEMGMGGGDGSVQRAAWHGRGACGLGAWPGRSCYTYQVPYLALYLYLLQYYYLSTYLPDLLGTVRVLYITGPTLKKSADNQIPSLLFAVPSPAVDRRLWYWRISKK